MMRVKLKVKPRSSSTLDSIVKQREVERKQKEYSKKYPDTYVDEIPKKVIQFNSPNDKWKLVLSCRRREDDDDGLPYVDMRLYLTSDRYTGYTKSGFSIPLLDKWDEFVETVNKMDKELHAKKGLF